MLTARSMAVALAITLLVMPIAALDSRPDFSGRWKLNEKESEVPQQMRGGGGGMGGGGMQGGGGMPGMGQPPGGRQSGGRPSRGQMRSMNILQSPEKLVITREDKSERMLQIGEGAMWKESRLLVERETPRGKLQEVWEISKEGKLIISTETPRGEVRLVYDRQK